MDATYSIVELMEDSAGVLTNLLQLATKVINWIVSNPLTLFGFITVIIGLAIGLVMKFSR